MGFKPGSQVTVDNALKMLMVKSANDIAVVLAEGVSGSVENFSAEMNQRQPEARHDPVELGQSERPAGRRADHLGARSRDPGRALLHDFPEYDMYWNIPAIQIGKKSCATTTR